MKTIKAKKGETEVRIRFEVTGEKPLHVSTETKLEVAILGTLEKAQFEIEETITE